MLFSQYAVEKQRPAYLLNNQQIVILPVDCCYKGMLNRPWQDAPATGQNH